MTNEEASTVLKNSASTLKDGIKFLKEPHQNQFKEAYEMAIQALEAQAEPTDEALHREREQAYMNGYEDASKRFRQEPQTGHWIPVSERLPEDDDYKPFSYYEDGAVLFCTKNGKIGFGWYYNSTKEWANEDDRYEDVIAWMPLPSSYQGEK